MIAYKKSGLNWARLFTIYLIISICLQWTGYWYSHLTGKSNHFIFNIELIIEILFYSYLFYHSINLPFLKSVVLVASAGTLIFVAINIAVIQGFFYYNTYTFYVQAVMVILFCLLYFYDLIKQDVIIHLYERPIFWISTGLFFFYFGDITYFLLGDSLFKSRTPASLQLYRYISFTLDLIQYAFFNIGFISILAWTKIKR